MPVVRAHDAKKFQSTLPARGATLRTTFSVSPSFDFNPRSPHGERLSLDITNGSRDYFNPRSPHGERPHALSLSDAIIYYFNPRSPHGERHATGQDTAALDTFQSTLPARGATQRGWFTEENFTYISIHAPRTGSDSIRSISDFISLHFNPRSPHGERRFGKELLINWLVISIHAPRTGSDGHTPPEVPQTLKFQSTLPARGATTL